jgi:hypothetical protein
MNLDQGGDSETRFAAYGAGLGALSVTRIGQAACSTPRSPVQRVEKLFDLPKRSLASVADADDPIAVALQ